LKEERFILTHSSVHGHLALLQSKATDLVAKKEGRKEGGKEGGREGESE
jgi:hypothetical protein